MLNWNIIKTFSICKHCNNEYLSSIIKEHLNFDHHIKNFYFCNCDKAQSLKFKKEIEKRLEKEKEIEKEIMELFNKFERDNKSIPTRIKYHYYKYVGTHSFIENGIDKVEVLTEQDMENVYNLRLMSKRYRTTTIRDWLEVYIIKRRKYNSFK